MSQIGKYSGAVLPGNPPFDKIAALVLLIEQVTGTLDWPAGFKIEFYRSNQEPDEATKRAWAEARMYPIDLGFNKYHSRNLGSAAEVVAKDLEIDPASNPDVKWLVGVANENNKTGYLKGFARMNNMPFIIRELYKPTMFVKAQVAVEMAAHVVATELKLQRVKPSQWRRSAERVKTDPVMKRIAATVTFSREPFTLSHYAFAMFVLGEDTAVIEQRLKFWVSKLGQAQTMMVGATEKAEKMEKFEFTINGHLCCHVVTDDDRVARALFTAHQDAPAMILAQRRSGHYQVLSNRKLWADQKYTTSVAKLTTILNRREQAVRSTTSNIWFHDSRICAALNGTNSLKDSPASLLKAATVIQLMQETIELPALPKTTLAVALEAALGS